MNLFYLAKPVIVQGLKNVIVREGVKLVMKCKATGYPQPYLIWQKENIELKNTSRILMKSDNSLTILNTTRHDAGQYECIARNAAGLESASTAVVKVNCKHYTWIYFNLGPIQFSLVYCTRRKILLFTNVVVFVVVVVIVVSYWSNVVQIADCGVVVQFFACSHCSFGVISR